MSNVWLSALVFGIGAVVTLVGVCQNVFSLPPDDWTLAIAGLVIMLIAFSVRS